MNPAPMLLILTLLVVSALLLVVATMLPGKAPIVFGLVGVGCVIALGYSQLSLRAGNLMVGLVIATLVVVALVWLRFSPVNRTKPLFALRQAAGAAGSAMPKLIDRTGVTISQLQPAGSAFVDGRRIAVVAETGLIDRGAPIKVIAVEGERIIVRAV